MRASALEFLVCPDISEHSICHIHVVYDAHAHTTQRRRSSGYLGGAARAQPADVHRLLGEAGLKASACTGRRGSVRATVSVYIREIDSKVWRLKVSMRSWGTCIGRYGPVHYC